MNEGDIHSPIGREWPYVDVDKGNSTMGESQENRESQELKKIADTVNSFYDSFLSIIFFNRKFKAI